MIYIPFKNPDQRKEYMKKYIKTEAYKKRQKENYLKNKLKINSKCKEYYLKNQPKIIELKKIYRKNNAEKIRLYMKSKMKEYFKQRRKIDILFKLKANISRRIRKDLKKFNSTKKESTQKILPYSMKELKEYIEKQFTPEMNWDNMGIIWEIDHSTPLSWAKSEQDILNLWALTNLRPLLKKENREKQDLFSGDINNTLSSIGR